MFKCKYYKCKCQTNWMNYRKQHNIVTSLRRKSIHNYFYDKCKEPNAAASGREFWHTIKPFISDKCNSEQSCITLLDDGKIVNDQVQVCNILNDYYVNIPKDIGQPDKIYSDSNLEDIITAHSDNESVTRIKNTTGQDKHFAFELVSVNEIYNRLLKLNCKKSVGYDSVPPRLLKAGAMQLSVPFTKLINNSITSCIFPDSLKCAKVIPIFKKDDIMNKNNCRPVSVLPCMSKVYEGVLVEQLNTYFNDIFSPYLSGFRKHHSCQNVLLRYVERCKQFLDSNKFYGSVLTDLSKAFDCLPHRLIIAKLKAYGVCGDSCMLMASYFQGRRQRVRIGNHKSEWMELDKGCPQGSLMGPLAYNIFSNDLLLLICEMCDIPNYADDNTPSCWGESERKVVNKLEIVTSLMMDWFQSNSKG